jgi:hypothetical protein
MCHHLIHPTKAVQNCQYDVCRCFHQPEACLCEEYDAYADECSMLGIHIPWKSRPEHKACSKSSKFLDFKHVLLLYPCLYRQSELSVIHQHTEFDEQTALGREFRF